MFGIFMDDGLTLVSKEAFKVVWNFSCLNPTFNGKHKWSYKGV